MQDARNRQVEIAVIVRQPRQRVMARRPLQLLLPQHRPPQRGQVAEQQVERVMVVLVAGCGSGESSIACARAMRA